MSIYLDREAYFKQSADLSGLMPISQREIEFLDVKPKPLIVQISLKEYFERIKRYKADRFQTDLCNRLQAAAENRHVERYWALYHAEGQLGKTSVMSQAFPAWLIGHDPLFRFALAMFNETQSEKHSQVVIDTLNMPLHKEIFSNRDGWLEKEKPSVSGWMTRARRELHDGQYSFNPVGLQSGLTGSGFDWLSIDDPYKEAKDAFSATVRENMARFYDFTVVSRTSLHGCITGMFHRYAPEDFAGFLLDKGMFDYIRYATICDGDYVHKETGKRFADPLGRQIGEFISPDRRPPEYYKEARKNKRVWLSMYQGRPSSEEGDFFNTKLIEMISPELAKQRRAECSILVRAWDLAATEEGGDYSVGVLGGIRPNGKFTVFDIIREQVDTAGRDALQLKTAKADGPNVIVAVPADVGAGGKSTAFHITQLLKDFTVVIRSVSGKKEDRARNFSSAVNSGDVEFVDDEDLPEDKKWNKTAKKELGEFPLSEHDDIVDAGGDCYNEARERFVKGKVIHKYAPQRNLVGYSAFAQKFPFYRDDKLLLKIPENFRIYIGLKIEADASLPTSGIITARAAENANLGETILAVSEYKAYDGNYQNLLVWLENALAIYCVTANTTNTTIWLHSDSSHFEQTLIEKFGVNVAVYDGDELDGIAETNWYLSPKRKAHQFNQGAESASLYFLIDDAQFGIADSQKATGFYHARQEMDTWGFNEKGAPNKIAAVLECLRMCVSSYATHAEPLTQMEKYARELNARLPQIMRNKTPEEIAQMPDTPAMSPQMTLQMTEELLRQEKRKKGEYAPQSPFDSPGDGGIDDLSNGW